MEENKEAPKKFTKEDETRIKNLLDQVSEEIAKLGGSSIYAIVMPVENDVRHTFSAVGNLQTNVYMLRFVEFQLLFREQIAFMQLQASQMVQGSKILKPGMVMPFDPKKRGQA